MSMRLALLARQTEVSAILQSNMQMMEIPSPEKSLPSQVPLLYMYCAVPSWQAQLGAVTSKTQCDKSVSWMVVFTDPLQNLIVFGRPVAKPRQVSRVRSRWIGLSTSLLKPAPVYRWMSHLLLTPSHLEPHQHLVMLYHQALTRFLISPPAVRHSPQSIANRGRNVKKVRATGTEPGRTEKDNVIPVHRMRFILSQISPDLNLALDQVQTRPLVSSIPSVWNSTRSWQDRKASE